MIDVAIIGAGPAGLSAAVNVAARNRRATVFGRDASTSDLYKAQIVDNYLGMGGMTGAAMLERFTQHARDSGAEFIHKKVLQIMAMDNSFMINAQGSFYEASALILATGAAKKNTVPNESGYIGKGVSYCATCDGMLYRNRTVIVIGDNAEAEEDVRFLCEICAKVYYFPLYDIGNSGVAACAEILKGRLKAVEGTDFVSGLRVDDTVIPCDGVFIIKEVSPPASLILGLEMDSDGVKVDGSMATGIRGVFAAGDCTGKPLQVAKAVSEGLIAAQSAARYLRVK